MKPLAFGFLIIAVLVAAPEKQKFTGVVTDSMCSSADHKSMRMGPTDAECTIACIREHGATYVLYDGKKAYDLNNQQTPVKFAGKRVTITGTLDAKTNTIQVDSIAPAK